MPLNIPILDDRTWNELTAEARALIPTLAPDWTNHNAADPGITLIELLVYFCEGLLYRLDQVGDAQVYAFLKLINGSRWKPGRDLDEDIRKTLLDLQRPHRAVTPADFELLALAANDDHAPDPSDRIARAKYVSRFDPDAIGSKTRSSRGHATVLVVPESIEKPSARLLHRVRDSLERARLLGTRIHIAAVRYVAVGVRIVLVVRESVSAAAVRKTAVEVLKEFFHPLRGGPDKQGWPFGRSLYVSEIYQLLADLDSVTLVKKSIDRETGRSVNELIVEPDNMDRLRYNRSGELEAVELGPDELVRALVTEQNIAVVSGGRGSSVTEARQ